MAALGLHAHTDVLFIPEVATFLGLESRMPSVARWTQAPPVFVSTMHLGEYSSTWAR